MKNKKFKIGDIVTVNDKFKYHKSSEHTLDRFIGIDFIVADITSNGYVLKCHQKKVYKIGNYYFAEAWLDYSKTVPQPKRKVTDEQIVKAIKSVSKQQENFAMIKSGDSLTLVYNGKTFVVHCEHPNYNNIVEAIKNKEYSKIETLVNLSKAVEHFGEGLLLVKDGIVSYDGKVLHGCIVDTILGLIKDGFSVTPIINFLANLNLNPSYRAVNELYDFLEYGKLPITEDGCFLTYKKIRSDWKDIHSGTFDNSIGAICEMPRNKVDEDSSRTCSAGLHVCSYEYTKHFGDASSRLVLCKVNPRDVVSIPKDYNNTKMRCCRYEVVAEVTDKSDVLAGKSLYKEK